MSATNKHADNSPEFEKAWSRLRFLNRRFWIVYFAYIPVAGSLCWLISLFTKSNIIALPALAWMAFWIYCGAQLSSFICPKCRHKFFSRQIEVFGINLGPFGTYHNPYSSKCLNCGLRKYTYPTDDAS